ncbi:peptidoglycan-binding protein [Prauserella cavernicola]|uniref:Peptidoglycan-binding protein n=1 Tax=Prauserella cavernicola TaxID=2800127 RepID=A0A934QQH8_9PSEU|nr:peptidoglycan-binding protein [Prauserella cavernicola]MBK1783859.1 peptidoglycan-binding protein [Prauserella cavernicola]
MSEDDATGPRRARRPRRNVLIALTAGVIAVGAGAGFGITDAVTANADEGDTDAPRAYDGTAEEIVRGDLSGSTTASGTLRFSGGRSIESAGNGILTGLPAPGSLVRLGDRLYAVDNVGVYLLRGDLPAWRDFETGMADGPDVRALEHSLRELGFFDGEPDEEFTWLTANAIELWQKDLGVEVTGRLPLGSVVFTRGDLRIGNLTAQVGDRVAPGAGLFETTGTTQVVDVDLPLADQRLAAKDKPVHLRLPDGAETTGTISSVGTPTEKESAHGGGDTVIPVVITLDDPDAAGSFQEASVTVDIPSETREDVLSVPVGALLALDARRFGIEIVGRDGGTRKVPVTTGLFAGGRVEVSGDGVRAGERVVVPSR